MRLPRAASVLAAGLIAGAACRSGPAPTAEKDGALHSTHFLIRWRAPAAREQEVQVLEQKAEAAYARYAELLGAARMPREPVTLRLSGKARATDFPYVDSVTGEVVLFRDGARGYDAALAHELVHAIRWKLWTEPQRQTDAFLFFEEGFAELLAMEAGFPSTGFPTYGYPVSIAAGAYLRAGEDLPIPDLIRSHKRLNLDCMAQAYALRISFMGWLREKVGLERLIELAYAPEMLTPELVEKKLGMSLEAMQSEWRPWALAQLEQHKDAEAQAKAFRTKTPMRHQKVCRGVRK